MTNRYDAIIIGTGQAGPSLAGRLTAAGMKVAIVERKRFGGTCVNNGCVPTKALVASARAAYMARRSSEFGVKIDGPVSVDMTQVKASQGRYRAEIERRCGALAQEHGERDRVRRPRALRLTARSARGRNTAGSGKDLHQRWCACVRAAELQGCRLLDQLEHDGCRFPAGALNRHRRKLHRPRVWSDVSAVRERGDGRGNGDRG